MTQKTLFFIVFSASLASCVLAQAAVTEKVFLHIAIDSVIERQRVVIGLYGDAAPLHVRRFIEQVESDDRFLRLRGTEISRVVFVSAAIFLS